PGWPRQPSLRSGPRRPRPTRLPRLRQARGPRRDREHRHRVPAAAGLCRVLGGTCTGWPAAHGRADARIPGGAGSRVRRQREADQGGAVAPVPAVGAACADLARWLPEAAVLTPDPDVQPGHRRAHPHSAPPWNAEAAAALHEAVGAIADIRLEFAHAVHGRYTWDPAIRRAGHALRAIARLAPAVPGDQAQDAAALLGARVSRIMQLPAIDLEQRWRAIRQPCPRCARPGLRYHDGGRGQPARLACFRCGRHARVVPGTISGGFAEWDDGEIT